MHPKTKEPTKKSPKRSTKKSASTKTKTPIETKRIGPHARSDDGNAFIRDPGEGPAHTGDDLAEALAEDFVAAATGETNALENDLDRTLDEEIGGPFVLTRASKELAHDVDASNPIGAEAEPLPKAMAGLVQRPPSGRGEEDDDA